MQYAATTDVLRPVKEAVRKRPELGKFGCVGTMCVVIDLTILTLLLRAGMSPSVANLAAFVSSSACNFLLSYFWTFGQRGHRGQGASKMAGRAVRYGIAAAILTGINSMVFALAKLAESVPVVSAKLASLISAVHMGDIVTRNRAAALFGLGVTALVAWQLQSRFVFRRRAVRPMVELPHAPITRLRQFAEGGIAWFLPAHNEVDNLKRVTDELVATMRQLGAPFRIVIVDDGSTDGTDAVAARLASSYSEVQVETHEVNRGYGPGLTSGMKACLATGAEFIGFYDADDQFRPHSVLTLLTSMLQHGVDFIIGRRLDRQDPAMRKINGKIWDFIAQRVMRFRAADTDCGCKLYRREVVGDILPHLTAGRGSAITPQILSHAQNLGFTWTETGVTHYPRTAGKNSGNNLPEIVRSFVDLFRSRLALNRTLREMGLARKRVNASTIAVVCAATVISVATYVHFYVGGQTIEYGDAVSHLLIARRIMFSQTPGLAQLGGVWLPLPHLLSMPLIWNNWAYYSGFAGSVVMMIAYVTCVLLVYKTVWHLTHRHLAAIAGAAVFAINPNILYMQSTPMTELLMFATMMGAVYCLTRWFQTDDSDAKHHLYLVGSGFSILLCGLTRYEGWTLGVVLAGVVLYGSLDRMKLLPRLLLSAFVMVSILGVGWGYSHFGVSAFAVLPLAFAVYLVLRRLNDSHDWNSTEGHFIAFGILIASAPVTWMIWNWAIFGDPLAFQRGAYAKPSLWVNSGEKAVGNIVISLRTYEIATVDNLTAMVTILALIGLAVFLWRTRLSNESLPVLALLVMFPFFVVTLYKGERPLHVYQYYFNFYNVRFGLVMLLPACILIGYLVGEVAGLLGRIGRARPWRALQVIPALAVLAALAVTAVGALESGNIVTLMEPTAGRATQTALNTQAAALWLKAHYRSGLMLMESYGNEEIAFASHVPLESQVYEGSYRQWLPALADPARQHIQWIVMRSEQGDPDQVYKDLHGSSLLHNFRLVWRDGDHLIYAGPAAVAQLTAERTSSAHRQTASSSNALKLFPATSRKSAHRGSQRPRRRHSRTTPARHVRRVGFVSCPGGTYARMIPTKVGNDPVGMLHYGTRLDITLRVTDEAPYPHRTARWYLIKQGVYVWAGCIST